MRVTTALLTVLLGLAEPSLSYGSDSSMTASSGGIGGLILKALNQARPKINPAIAQSMPDPLHINVGKSGKANAGCIIPNPWGGCICRASADYSVSLKDVTGLKGVHVTNFTNASVSADMTAITVEADLADGDIMLKGPAHAVIDACQISQSESGHASTHARLQKAHLTAAATGKLDLLHACIKLNFTKITIQLNQMSIHNTSVNINLGPIPGSIDVGSFVDLVAKEEPELTKDVEHAVQGPISKAMTNTAAKGDIPCIPIPHRSALQAQEVLLV